MVTTMMKFKNEALAGITTLGTLRKDGPDMFVFTGTPDGLNAAVEYLVGHGFVCDNDAAHMGRPEVYGELWICDFDAPGFMIVPGSKVETAQRLAAGMDTVASKAKNLPNQIIFKLGAQQCRDAAAALEMGG